MHEPRADQFIQADFVSRRGLTQALTPTGDYSLAYTIPKHHVLPYAPEVLRSFSVYGFEWIDNLHFLADPKDFIVDAVDTFLLIAREMFTEAGWAGDGDIRLLWLPPFAFPLALGIPPEGIVLWHVKQEEDGVSFILSPIELPFEEFRHEVA